jgi:hypothetical protein
MKAIGWAAFGVSAVAVTVGSQPRASSITRPISWVTRGVWLQADLHTHTRFSDGSHSVEEVVATAARNHCDVIAITDHTDAELKAATPEYIEAIHEARAKHPDVTIITGIEWNVPPGKGAEHATVLFPAAREDINKLMTFKERFDDWDKKGENPELARQGLLALRPLGTAVAPIALFNHPSRKPNSDSAPRLTFPSLVRLAPEVLIGIEGAPGHQRSRQIGAYPSDGPTVDRWDPMVAATGGAWDEWLGAGLDAWAAIAGSDFHAEADDFWPCEFAGTWIYAPDRTIDGVIRALHAGAFFAEHGHIINRAELQVQIDGGERPIVAGETAAVRGQTKATVTLRLSVPERDFARRANHVDLVELIGISNEGARVIGSGAPDAGGAFETTVVVPAGGIVLRARGRRLITGGPALWFYTNPIRLTPPAR